MENIASSRSYLAGEKKSEEISLYQLPSRIGYFLLQEVTKKHSFGMKNLAKQHDTLKEKVIIKYSYPFAEVGDLFTSHRILKTK